MWPLAVAMELARCLRTSVEVRPGQVVKNPESIALIQVLGTGEKAALWRKLMVSFFLVSS